MSDPDRTLTYSEAEMCLRAEARTSDASVHPRKTSRKAPDQSTVARTDGPAPVRAGPPPFHRTERHHA
jgi:hypothetical protein